MHKFLTLKIDDDSDNENNKINYCKTVNFKINNNSTNDNKNITYDYHKVHRYCHDFLFSPKSLYITPNINQKERKKRYIKLQVKGYTKKISYNEFQKIKALDKKKLINTRDTLKNRIKIKFIDSTQRMILLKLKRQNMIKLTEIYKMMLEAKCDKIESISNVKDIREIKQKIKKVSNMGINIIKKVNEELNTKEVNISSDNINKVITLIKNEINNCFDIETYMN